MVYNVPYKNLSSPSSSHTLFQRKLIYVDKQSPHHDIELFVVLKVHVGFCFLQRNETEQKIGLVLIQHPCGPLHIPCFL